MSEEKKLISAKLPHIFYGGDYNPEQWPEEIWPEDARLMQEAGVNLVSLGIFSWSKLEPQPDQYDFGWLDQVMDLLHEHGIKVDLATATASPPPWLAKLYPDSLPVTRNGVKLWPGSRQAYCPSSPAYRERIQKLVNQVARRYQHHPALLMWHINNEYACHVAECYCESSAAAFRVWLRQRYNTIESLNEAWGTAFWSQRYYDWDEINPPRATPTFINPTQQLDFKRFSSDELLTCFELEREILREVTPDLPVTTNFMGFFKPLDYWKWATREDIVSNDAYPDPSDPGSKIDSAMAYDLMRSLGGGKAWILMEQTTAQVNWRPQNALKPPGQMRLGSYQAVARGAEGVMFFQWRASKAGSEKFHSGMLPHVGTENSRIWREVTRLGRELRGLDELLDSRVRPKVAIMLDWESWWALELDTHPSNAVQQMAQLKSYYEPLFKQNIAVDFVSPGADLKAYRVVLVPNLYLVRDELAENLEQFVAEGGTLIMSFFSGIVDQNDHIRLGGYPAPFRKLLGLRVEEFEPYQPGQVNHFKTETSSYRCDIWSDMLDLEGAEALGCYTEGYFAGRPALTRHKFGQGQSYYLGTHPEYAFMAELLGQVCQEAGVIAPLNLPAGVEAVRRENNQHSFTFLLNHNSAPVELELTESQIDLLNNSRVGQKLRLEALGVAILKAQN